jgi:hypothetical protein
MGLKNEKVCGFAMAFLGICLCYANVATIFRASYFNWFGFRLPMIDGFESGMMLFGVFSYFEDDNHAICLFGGDSNQSAGWRDLNSGQYFPMCVGAQQSRMWASRHLRELNSTEHWQVWLDMGWKILQRHNRLHPDQPLTRVAFQSRSWPRSAKGYYAREAEATVNRLWVVAELDKGEQRATRIQTSSTEELPFRE